MPWGGARGQNLGHFKKCFSTFSVIEITYADMAKPCDMDLWANDFALYLEDYLMYEHHTLGS